MSSVVPAIKTTFAIRLFRAIGSKPSTMVVLLVLGRGFLDGLAYQHPDDPILLSGAGLQLVQGELAGVYLDERVQVGPLGLLLYGIAGSLREAGFDLIMSVSMVSGIIFAVALGACSYAISRSRRAALVAIAVAAVAGLSWTASTSGHATEGLVALFWLFAAYSAQQGKAMRSGAALGIAAAVKLFALLGIPLLLLLPSLRRRLGAFLVLVMVGMLLWMPSFLVGSFNMFEFGWEIRPHSPLAIVFHAGREFGWQLRVVQAIAICGIGGVAALLLREDPLGFLKIPLALMGLRLLTDPLDYHYYLLGAGTIALLGWVLLINADRPVWWLGLPSLYYLGLLPFFVLGGTSLAIWIILLAALLLLPALLGLRTKVTGTGAGLGVSRISLLDGSAEPKNDHRLKLCIGGKSRVDLEQ